MGRRRVGIGGNVSVLAAFLALFSIIIAFTQGWLNALSLDTGIGANLIAVSPGLFFCVLGLLWLSHVNSAWSAVGSCGVLGVGFAVLASELNVVGILTASMLGGATLAQLETLLIVAGFVMGGAVAASRRD